MKTIFFILIFCLLLLPVSADVADYHFIWRPIEKPPWEPPQTIMMVDFGTEQWHYIWDGTEEIKKVEVRI